MANREELEILLKWKQQNEQAAKDVSKQLDEIKKNTDALGGSMADTAKAGAALGGGFLASQAAAEALLGTLQAIPGAVLGWSKAAIEAGGNLADLSAKTAIGVEALQKLRPLGADVGISMEQMARSIVRMQKTMELNPEVFAKFGISLAEIKDLKPEEQFLAIAKSIAGITDPATQAAAQAQLLGDRTGDMLKIIRSGNLDLQDFGGLTEEQAEHLDAMGDALGRAKIALENMGLALTAAFIATPDNVRAIETITDTLQGLAIFVRDEGPKIVEGARLIAAAMTFGVSESVVRTFGQLTAELRKLKEAQDAIAAPAVRYKMILDAQQEALRGLRAEQEEHRKAVEENAKKAAEEAKKLARDEFNARAKAMADEEKAIEKWKRTQEQSMQRAAASVKLVTGDVMDLNAEMAKLGGAGLVPQKPLEIPPVGKILEPWKKQLKDGLSDLPKIILGAIQGGGDALKSIGAHLAGKIFGDESALKGTIEKKFKDVLGPGIGGALGSVIPGLGTMLGSLAGGLGEKLFGGISKAIGNLFGGKEKEVNKLRDAFIASAGGIDTLKRKAAEAGVSLDALFAAKDSRKGLQAAIDAVKNGLDSWDQAHEELQAAIDKYGFTVEELGPKFRAQELDKQAAQLFKEYELLKASGIELVTINARMGPAFNEYVQTAIAAGQAIPESMRGIIEGLIQQGQLLDENGEAYASVEDAGISFTQTMTEQFQTLIEKLDQFVSAILGMPTSVPPIHIPVVPQVHGGGDGGGGNEGGFVGGDTGLEEMRRGGVVVPFLPRAANGIVSAQPGGTPVLVGEGGQSELVAPVRALADQIGTAAAKAAMSVAGGRTIVVPVYLNGREIARAVADENRRGGLPIKEASIVR